MDPIDLFLVRHGNTFEQGQTPLQVGLKSDMELTAKGREQAAAMAAFLKSSGIFPAVIYAGSLRRQKEAAAIIAQGCGGRPAVENHRALDELDYGLWEGLSEAEIAERWPAELKNWSEAGMWPAGVFEASAEEKEELLRSFIAQLRNGAAGQSVIAVSSNGLIRMFAKFVPGMWEQHAGERRMKELKVGTGNYCRLQILPDRLSVRSWNQKPAPPAGPAECRK